MPNSHQSNLVVIVYEWSADVGGYVGHPTLHFDLAESKQKDLFEDELVQIDLETGRWSFDEGKSWIDIGIYRHPTDEQYAAKQRGITQDFSPHRDLVADQFVIGVFDRTRNADLQNLAQAMICYDRDVLWASRVPPNLLGTRDRRRLAAILVTGLRTGPGTSDQLDG